MPNQSVIPGFVVQKPHIQISCSDNGMVVSLPLGREIGLVISIPQGAVMAFPPSVLRPNGCLPDVVIPGSGSGGLDLSGEGVVVNFDTAGEVTFPDKGKIGFTGKVTATSWKAQGVR